MKKRESWAAETLFMLASADSAPTDFSVHAGNEMTGADEGSTLSAIMTLPVGLRIGTNRFRVSLFPLSALNGTT